MSLPEGPRFGVRWGWVDSIFSDMRLLRARPQKKGQILTSAAVDTHTHTHAHTHARTHTHNDNTGSASAKEK